MINLIIFFLIGGSFLILFNISPIHKIFLLILLYLLGSIIILYLDNYYQGLTYIIIYVGAIAILFLFVLMMMNLKNMNQVSYNSYLFFLFLFFLLLPYIQDNEINIYNIIIKDYIYSYIKLYDIQLVSIFLYNGLYINILILGLLLWIVLIGILSQK